MSIKYVIFRQKAQYGWISHHELKNHFDVMLDKDVRGTLLSVLNNIHTAARMNLKFQLPFKFIWYHCYLDEDKLNCEDEIIFMFEDGSRTCFDPEYINYLRKKYKKSHFVFAAFNSSFRYPPKRLKQVEETYDFITSFDRKDCKERGWGLYTGTYSKLVQHCAINGE